MQSKKHITKYELDAFNNDVCSKYSNYAALTVSGTTPITTWPADYGLTLGEVADEVYKLGSTTTSNKYATRSDASKVLPSGVLPSSFISNVSGFTVKDEGYSMLGYTTGYINCILMGAGNAAATSCYIYKFVDNSGTEVKNMDNKYYYVAAPTYSGTVTSAATFSSNVMWVSPGMASPVALTSMNTLAWRTCSTGEDTMGPGYIPFKEYVDGAGAFGEYFTKLVQEPNRHIAEKDIHGCFLVDASKVSSTGAITSSGGVSEAATILFTSPSVTRSPSGTYTYTTNVTISFYIYDCSTNSFMRAVSKSLLYDNAKISKTVMQSSSTPADGSAPRTGYWYYSYGYGNTSSGTCTFGNYFNPGYNIYSPAKAATLFYRGKNGTGSNNLGLSTIGLASNSSTCSNSRTVTVDQYGKVTVTYPGLPAVASMPRCAYYAIHDAVLVNGHTLDYTILAKDIVGTVPGDSGTDKTFTHTINYGMSSQMQQWGFTAAGQEVRLVPSYTKVDLNPKGTGLNFATVTYQDTPPVKQNTSGGTDGGSLVITAKEHSIYHPSGTSAVDVIGSFTCDWNRCISASGPGYTLEEDDPNVAPGAGKKYNFRLKRSGLADTSSTTVAIIPFKPIHTQWGTEAIRCMPSGIEQNNGGCEGNYAMFDDNTIRKKVPSVVYTSPYSITIQSNFKGERYPAPNYIATGGDPDTWEFSSSNILGTMTPNIVIVGDGTVSVDSYTITFTAAEMNQIVTAGRYDFYYGTLDARLTLH